MNPARIAGLLCLLMLAGCNQLNNDPFNFSQPAALGPTADRFETASRDFRSQAYAQMQVMEQKSQELALTNQQLRGELQTLQQKYATVQRDYDAITQGTNNATTPLLAQLRQQSQQLDASNVDLHTRLAQEQQQRVLMQRQLELLQQRLTDTNSQLQEIAGIRDQTQRQLAALQASSTNGRGTAALRANNSLRTPLKPVQVAGLDVRQDGDVIRIALPADQLFQSGTLQISPSGNLMLSQLASTVAGNYPNQRIVVEGHTDQGSVPAGTSAHQLTSMQSIVVLEQLVSRNGMPRQQVTAMAHGTNHPRFAGGAASAGNRRVEVVIYPETVR